MTILRICFEKKTTFDLFDYESPAAQFRKRNKAKYRLSFEITDCYVACRQRVARKRLRRRRRRRRRRCRRHCRRRCSRRRRRRRRRRRVDAKRITVDDGVLSRCDNKNKTKKRKRNKSTIPINDLKKGTIESDSVAFTRIACSAHNARRLS